MVKDKDDNIELKLTEKIQIRDDNFMFRFGFPTIFDVLGLSIGEYVIFSAYVPTK